MIRTVSGNRHAHRIAGKMLARALPVAGVLLVVGTAAHAQSLKNEIVLPFNGTVAGETESIAVSGNVSVKTKHYPGRPEKPIVTVYKIDKASSGVGMTSGQTYPTGGRTTSKFRYAFATPSDPRGLNSLAQWCIICGDGCLSDPSKCKLCCYNLQVQLDFASNGVVQPGESGAIAMNPPVSPSCTQVVEVCN